MYLHVPVSLETLCFNVIYHLEWDMLVIDQIHRNIRISNIILYTIVLWKWVCCHNHRFFIYFNLNIMKLHIIHFLGSIESMIKRFDCILIKLSFTQLHWILIHEWWKKLLFVYIVKSRKADVVDLFMFTCIYR